MLTLDVIENEIKTLIEHGTNYEDCARLANLYICKAGMTDTPIVRQSPTGNSEFARAFAGAGEAGFSILEDMIEVLKAVNPNLYISTIQALKEAGQ